MLRPKSTVRYRMGGAHCGMCEYFVEGPQRVADVVGNPDGKETGTCKLVEGEIGEDMLCNLFKPKNGPAEPAAAKPRFAQKANVY